MVDKISDFLMQFFIIVAIVGFVWSFMPKSLYTVEKELEAIRQQLEQLNRTLKERQ